MSTPDITPDILKESDLKFYLSGGYYNADPKQSLGGPTSSYVLPSGSLHALFDRVDTSEATAGDVEFRCIYLRNIHPTKKLIGAKIWIETGTVSQKTAIAISLGSAGVNGEEPTIPSEGIAPPMNFFEVPLQMPQEPNIGDLYPGDSIGLWVRWVVQPGTESIENDKAVIRIDGEREVESSSGIPDPTDPPSEVCPQGYKWDPTQNKCVIDTTVIVCPNGYTYNSTLQRCVPPSTPPPSVGSWMWAHAGDFSCSDDADETYAMYRQKFGAAPGQMTAGENQSLLIINGDFSYEDGDQSCFIDLNRTLGNMFPNSIAPTIGNHDDTEDGCASDRQDIISTFPLIPSVGFYAITRKNIRFILMDTQSRYTSGSPQHTFVLAELQKAAADPAIKWIVVAYHKPSLISDTDHSVLTDLRTLYHPLFDQYKVDMVLSGHAHVYFRSKPLKHNASDPAAPNVVIDQASGTYTYSSTTWGVIYNTNGCGGRRSNHTFDGAAPNYVGHRQIPPPFGSTFCTLEDNGNKMHCQFIANNSGQVLDDFTIAKPGASSPGPVQCPQGYNWDETLGQCVQSVVTCPTGYTWDPTRQVCRPSSTVPTPPTSPGYPLTNVEWYYEMTATSAVPQTINVGSYDTVEQIITPSSLGGITNTTIDAEGWLNIQYGGGLNSAGQPVSGRVAFDYSKKAKFTSDTRAPLNVAVAYTFYHDALRTSHAVKAGSDPAGFPALNNRLFDGFYVAIVGNLPHTNGVINTTSLRTEYWNEPPTFNTGVGCTDAFTRYAFPSSRTLTQGRAYNAFVVWREDNDTDELINDVWIDFSEEGSTTPNWVWTARHNYGISNWNPCTVPVGFTDTNELINGPTGLKKYRMIFRNNEFVGGSTTPLKIKNVKIGVLPPLPEGTTTPPPTEPPPTNPPPTTPGGGITDSNGILWMEAKGTQGVIGQSRTDAGDFRWSDNINDVNGGYEVTAYFTFSGVSGDGHFAMKHWGPNHCGDCENEEGGSCCCWYDTGIRSNGDVQLEIERPHPSNDEFSLTLNPTSGPLYMTNVGKPMNGNTIGLKWLVYPVTYPGGSADNGGIRLKMWVDTAGLGTNGRPQNQWRLVYNFLDTGQVLGDYDVSGFGHHDLEIRNSDTDDTETYAGGLHWKKYRV